LYLAKGRSEKKQGRST